MEPEQKAVLRKWRAELVKNINIRDGLFTQLFSKNVLANRTVNRIKNNRPPEEQVEELLDELQKRDCFNQFCEALIADGQEHIVKKFLRKEKKVVETNDSIAPPATSDSTQTSHSVNIPSETIDSLGSQSRRPIVIRESDNKHVYIRYNDESSPSKRCRGTDVDKSVVLFEPGETRYAMKHFLADAIDLHEKRAIQATNDSNSIMVLDNPQSIFLNHNISDPSQYMAAFTPQYSSVHSECIRPEKEGCPLIFSSASVSLKDSPCKNVEQNDPRNLLRPNIANTHPSLLVQMNAHNQGKFVNLSESLAASNLKVSHFSNPHQYSDEAGVKSTPMGQPISLSPPVRGPGLMDQLELSRSDSVDSPKCPAFVYPVPAAAAESRIKPSSAFPSYKDMSCSTPNSVEMEDIDLPDGCVNVKVEHCTQEFFHSNYKKSYPMRQMPRGFALIINVNEVVGKPARTGTNFDRDNLCNLLTQLHFNIMVYNDADGLSAQEIVIKLKYFARMEQHSQSDACFICLLSHGEEEFIFGTDGKRIPLNEIFMLFDNNNCKGLIGKPKVFIIQACRGGSLDKGVLLDEPDGGTLPARLAHQLPSMSDMLICYPTLIGYYAWRNRARGSWYIEAIVQIFMRFAKNEDVCAMLNRVNHLVSRKVSESTFKEMNQMSQMSEYKSTLRYPYLYLFPGIAIKASTQQNAGLNRRL